MKKKQFFFTWLLTAAAATLGLTSCSNDMMPDEPMREGEVDFTISTTLPQEIQTYADAAELTSSAEGGLKNLANSDVDYKVRFIMEVYPKGATETTEPIMRKIQYKSIKDADCRNTSFSARLLAAEYDFVFWADIVKQCKPYGDYWTDEYKIPGLKEDNCLGNRYFVSNDASAEQNPDNAVLVRIIGQASTGAVKGDLRTIKAAWDASETNLQHETPEMYDGYAAHKAIDLRFEPPTEEIVLTRPFAKLRLLATDIDILKDKNPAWDKTTVTITADNLPNAYNILSGEAFTLTEQNNIYKYWDSESQANANGIYSVDPTEYSDVETIKDKGKTLYVFYLPVPDKAQELTFNITARDKSGNVIAETKELNVSPVPLYKNKLTTIKGSFLSKNPTFDIRIDDEFEDDETIVENKEVSTVADLKNALNGEDQQFTFTSKVTKAEGFELDFTDMTRTALELNKATIILNFASIEEGAVITVKGDANSPKVLQLNTNTKCSVRMNFPATTTVALNGKAFKYLLYNCTTKRIVKPSVDALFYVNNDIAAIFFPANVETYHEIALTSAFTLDTEECANAFSHANGTCDFVGTINSWLSTNSGKTVWDFVGNPNN